MNRDVVLFLGPSLPREEVPHLPGLRVLPPARRGDLERLDPARTDLVLLVDGLMVYDHPPSPAEVADAVRRGIPVIGAASLGALRAVELRHCGVHGHGWVHQAFLERRITDDDELVARLHPRTGRPVTLFTVNLRAAAESLVAAGALAHGRAAALLAAVAAVHFEERTAARVRAVAADCGLPAALVDELLAPRFDVKAADARSLLRRLVDGELDALRAPGGGRAIRVGAAVGGAGRGGGARAGADD